MWRWLLFLFLSLAGVTAIALGIYIELEVQYEIGNWNGVAHQFYGGEIRDYREQVFLYLTAGPIILFLAYLLRPRRRREDDPGVTRKTEPWSQQ